MDWRRLGRKHLEDANRYKIVIPHSASVELIDDTAFYKCSSLRNVVFCDEIEELGLT
jgi:hypothetical protein